MYVRMYVHTYSVNIQVFHDFYCCLDGTLQTAITHHVVNKVLKMAESCMSLEFMWDFTTPLL